VRVAKRARHRAKRGSGSIVERNGRFLARWSTTEGGKRVRVAKTFALRNDAEWWLSEIRRHGDAPDDPLVSVYLERWLRSKRSIAASTHRQYTEHVRLHIVPVIGGYRLSELRRRHVEELVEDRGAYVSPTLGRRLSPATVGKITTSNE